MFDLSQAIERWKRSFKGQCSFDDIEELETHLTEYFEELTHSGVQSEEAFVKSVERMGDSQELSREFAKVRSIGERIHDRLKSLDLALFLLLFLICGMGVAFVYSAASSDSVLLSKIWIRQAFWVGVGFIAMFLVTQVKPARIKQFAPYIYGVSVVLLTANLFAGDEYAGVHRRIDLGLILLQPSALIPLVIPMMIAWVLTKPSLKETWKGFTLVLIVILLPSILILLQPDVGMALLCASAGWITLFLSPCRARLLRVTCLILPIVFLAAWTQLMPYQVHRIEVLLNPETDPLGAGWHALQVEEAVNSGGFLGRGWLNAETQLPHKHSDFILTIIAEQFGTVGVIALMVCFGALLYRTIAISKRSLDGFYRILGYGFAGIIFVQIAVNVGTAYGFIPLIGVPLPLISYGGSSVVVLLVEFGALSSFHRHERMKRPKGTHAHL